MIFNRAQDVALRKEYVNLVEGVRESGGDVKIFSSMHISGERKFFFITSHHVARAYPSCNL